jgi:hypothetical protein
VPALAKDLPKVGVLERLDGGELEFENVALAGVHV